MILLLLWLLPVGTSPAAPRIEVPAELKDQPARWLTSWKQKVEEQLSFLTAAYDLDVDMQQVVRDELLMRWRLQADYEETELKKIPDAPVPGKGDEDEQNAEAMRLLFAFYDHMPLNEERVVEWLEATLPPDVAAAGRPRWNELIQRRERKRRAKEADIRRRSGEKRLIIRARASRRAALSDRGKPMPAGRAPAAANTDGAREAAIVRPARGLFERPPEEGAAAASNDRLPPMPQVEDWYRHLFRFADEHHFNNRQLAAAKAMVEDLARRADEYLATFPVTYTRLDLTTSKRAYRVVLKEQNLDAAFEAFFEELRQRIRTLAGEQVSRARATGSPLRSPRALGTAKTGNSR